MDHAVMWIIAVALPVVVKYIANALQPFEGLIVAKFNKAIPNEVKQAVVFLIAYALTHAGPFATALAPLLNQFGPALATLLTGIAAMIFHHFMDWLMSHATPVPTPAPSPTNGHAVAKA